LSDVSGQSRAARLRGQQITDGIELKRRGPTLKMFHQALRFLAIAMFAWAQSTATPCAQEQRRPTDQELKAGYCLGWFEAQAEALRSYCATATACPPQHIQKQAEKQKRVAVYLAAKGFPDGAVPTASQGANDYNRCTQALGSDEAMACNASCVSRTLKDPDYLRRCAKTCNPDVCARGEACEKMDYLP
jgi:hypothetical protein